jgi:hypothetical protein
MKNNEHANFDYSHWHKLFMVAFLGEHSRVCLQFARFHQ